MPRYTNGVVEKECQRRAAPGYGESVGPASFKKRTEGRANSCHNCTHIGHGIHLLEREIPRKRPDGVIGDHEGKGFPAASGDAA